LLCEFLFFSQHTRLDDEFFELNKTHSEFCLRSKILYLRLTKRRNESSLITAIMGDIVPPMSASSSTPPQEFALIEQRKFSELVTLCLDKQLDVRTSLLLTFFLRRSLSLVG
jgi:hypothetical protein